MHALKIDFTATEPKFLNHTRVLKCEALISNSLSYLNNFLFSY